MGFSLDDLVHHPALFLFALGALFALAGWLLEESILGKLRPEKRRQCIAFGLCLMAGGSLWFLVTLTPPATAQHVGGETGPEEPSVVGPPPPPREIEEATLIFDSSLRNALIEVDGRPPDTVSGRTSTVAKIRFPAGAQQVLLRDGQRVCARPLAGSDVVTITEKDCRREEG